MIPDLHPLPDLQNPIHPIPPNPLNNFLLPQLINPLFPQPPPNLNLKILFIFDPLWFQQNILSLFYTFLVQKLTEF